VFEYSFDKKERKMIDEQQNITNFANIKSIGIRKKNKKKKNKEKSMILFFSWIIPWSSLHHLLFTLSFFLKKSIVL
jgi:prephenate dehydratase